MEELCSNTVKNLAQLQNNHIESSSLETWQRALGFDPNILDRQRLPIDGYDVQKQGYIGQKTRDYYDVMMITVFVVIVACLIVLTIAFGLLPTQNTTHSSLRITGLSLTPLLGVAIGLVFYIVYGQQIRGSLINADTAIDKLDYQGKIIFRDLIIANANSNNR